MRLRWRTVNPGCWQDKAVTCALILNTFSQFLCRSKWQKSVLDARYPKKPGFSLSYHVRSIPSASLRPKSGRGGFANNICQQSPISKTRPAGILWSIDRTRYYIYSCSKITAIAFLGRILVIIKLTQTLVLTTNIFDGGRSTEHKIIILNPHCLNLNYWVRSCSGK